MWESPLEPLRERSALSRRSAYGAANVNSTSLLRRRVLPRGFFALAVAFARTFPSDRRSASPSLESLSLSVRFPPAGSEGNVADPSFTCFFLPEAPVLSFL